jgi:hypothetical protein
MADEPIVTPPVAPPMPAPEPLASPTTTPTPAPEAPAPAGFEFSALKLPEGVEVLPEQSARFMEVLADTKMSGQERAQALVDLQGKVLEQAATKIAEAWTAQRNTWQEEIRKDAAIGGDKLEPALGQISKLIDAHGTAELRQAMDSTGMGDNPHMIRFLHKVAGYLNEGGNLPGGIVPQTERTQAQRIFTTMQ